MKLGVVSDTHGNLRTTQQAVSLLEEQDIAAVVHCGDIVSAEIVPLFAQWPTHFVFGNCDSDADSIRLTIQDCGQTCHEEFGELKLSGRQIAFLHGDDVTRLREAINSAAYDLVCYGHTHKAEQHRIGSTLVLNPGALHRADPHTFAVVDLKTMGVELVPLDAAG